MSSRNGNDSKTNGCQTSPKGIQNFNDIVKDYKKKYNYHVDGTLKFYASLSKDLDKAIHFASFGKGENELRHSHQRRLQIESLKKVEVKLYDAKKALKKCNSFEELFELVEKEIRPIYGIGPVMVYDTAHRIGAALSLEPQKVYLHAGTREGANALNLGKRKSTLSMNELPKAFQKLKPYEVEDCLCIYKSNLKKITNNARNN